MREPARHTVRGPAGQLVVWDYAGGAPATLLLHGIGNHGRVWDFVADAIAILDGLGLLESLERAAEVKGGGRLLLGSS